MLGGWARPRTGHTGASDQSDRVLRAVRPVLRGFVTASTGEDDPEAQEVFKFWSGQTGARAGQTDFSEEEAEDNAEDLAER